MFEQQLAYGKVGESQIANWLKRKGYNILPVYEKEVHEGKGPQLFTAAGTGLVAPDMLAFKDTKVFWVEAKHKTVFSYYRRGGYWCTGIDLRHYEDYQRVAGRSPWPVWLMFLHCQSKTSEHTGTCPTGLFGGELSYLRQHESHRSDRHGRSGMVYWAEKTLRPMATLDEMYSNATPVPLCTAGTATPAVQYSGGTVTW